MMATGERKYGSTFEDLRVVISCCFPLEICKARPASVVLYGWCVLEVKKESATRCD